MERLVIKFADGTYLGKAGHDLHVDKIDDAYMYTSQYNIERLINNCSSFKTKSSFKGSMIVNKETGQVIKSINIYNFTLKNARITKTTNKAFLINDKFWVPKSQLEETAAPGEFTVSDLVWKETFQVYSNIIKDNYLDLSLL